MSKELENKLQQYAYNLVSGAVKQEYENLIDLWAIHIENLVAYSKLALKAHEAFLTDVKASIKKEEEQKAAFAMFAFSVLGGPAISWVSGAIQYKAIPKMFGTTQKTGLYAQTSAAKMIIDVYDKQAHNKVHAKVFGDFAGQMVQDLLINPILSTGKSDEDALNKAIQRVGDSMSIDIFEANIKNALREAKIMGGTAITNYAGAILKDHDFGRKWVAKANEVRAQEYRRPVLNFNLALSEQAFAEKLINEAVDLQRKKWASDPAWFYYGNTPPPINAAYVTNAMEVEIWRVWILMENFQRYEYSLFRDDATEQDEYRVKGRSGIDVDRVLTRLVQLGVVAGRDPRELKGWMDRWNNRGKELGLISVEVGNIEGFVDTDAERLSILNWAKDRKPNLAPGTGAGVPRKIGPIDPANVPKR